MDRQCEPLLLRFPISREASSIAQASLGHRPGVAQATESCLQLFAAICSKFVAICSYLQLFAALCSYVVAVCSYFVAICSNFAAILQLHAQSIGTCGQG